MPRDSSAAQLAFSGIASSSGGIGGEPCRALTPVARRMEESKDPARTAAAALQLGLCPSISPRKLFTTGIRPSAVPAGVGNRSGNAAGDAGAGLNAKRGATAPPHPDSPPWSICFQLGDPAGESHPLAPRVRTGRGSSCRCFLEEMPHLHLD